MFDVFVNITAACAVDLEFVDIVSPMGAHGTPLALHGSANGIPMGSQWDPMDPHGVPWAFNGLPMWPQRVGPWPPMPNTWASTSRMCPQATCTSSGVGGVDR